MKEYRRVLEFKYKNQKYRMYLDNNNRRFFLKVNDGGDLSYVTDREFAELTIFFASTPKIMKIRKDAPRENIVPKVISGGVTVALTLSVILGGFTQIGFKFENLFPSLSASQVIESEEDLGNYISLASSEENQAFDTYRYKDENKIEIYDMDYLDMVMEKEDIGLDNLIEAVNINPSIHGEFKEILYEYCEALTSKYPNIDLRVFYNNLKTLKVEELSEEEIYDKMGYSDCYGYYVRNSNEIYVLENMDYKNNPWAHQVIYHEITHSLRIGNYEIDGKKVKVLPEGPNFNNEITSEALTSLFAVSLFDYEEDDIAYQLQSNYYSIMLECMDNYDLSDYADHSLSYFVDKLDEYNKDDDFAGIILELIYDQYKEHHSSLIEVDQSEYYPIYDYICDMYYRRYITDDMTYDEATSVADILVSKVTCNVPSGYNIDTQRFYDNLNSYMVQMENVEKTR